MNQLSSKKRANKKTAREGEPFNQCDKRKKLEFDYVPNVQMYF